jgi:hypothetical protein
VGLFLHFPRGSEQKPEPAVGSLFQKPKSKILCFQVLGGFVW